jgi:hypothetical protein
MSYLAGSDNLKEHINHLYGCQEEYKVKYKGKFAVDSARVLQTAYDGQSLAAVDLDGIANYEHIRFSVASFQSSVITYSYC